MFRLQLIIADKSQLCVFFIYFEGGERQREISLGNNQKTDMKQWL